MKVRGYWDTVGRIFNLTALPMMLLARLVLEEPLDVAIFSGIAFGILFGLIMAHWVRGDTIVLPFTDQQEFVGRLRVVLAENNYHPENSQGDYHVFGARSATIKVGPLELGQPEQFKVFVQLSANAATVVGPRNVLGILKRNLAH